MLTITLHANITFYSQTVNYQSINWLKIDKDRSKIFYLYIYFQILMLFQIRGLIALALLPALCWNNSKQFQCNKGVPKSICLPENYSKFELPFPDQPNLIGISIDIDEVLGISGKDYSITFATYFNVEVISNKCASRKTILGYNGLFCRRKKLYRVQ